MSENTRVSGSVNVESGSKERVAFDLAVRIASDEKPGAVEREERTREYWLDLYSACLNRASGYTE